MPLWTSLHTSGGSRSRLDMLVLVISMIARVALDLISALAIGLLLYLVLRRTRLTGTHQDTVFTYNVQENTVFSGV